MTHPNLHMLTPITTPTSSDLWELTKSQHEEAGLNFGDWWQYYQQHGYIVQEPGFILMYGDDIVNGRDAWLVWWMAHNIEDPFTRMARHMAYWRPEVCFCRGARGDENVRYYSTNRLLGFTKA